MEITSENQLVPLYKEPHQIIPYRPAVNRPVSISGNSGDKRYAPLSSSRFSGNLNQPGENILSYNSSLRFNALQKNRVGLFIDIYA
jgi:hypothetical protein